MGKPVFRELTAEGRFESGLDNLVAGKRFAFLAVVGENYPARLGAAVENEPGYYPIPEFWAHADSFDAMQAHADRLNAEMGITEREAEHLVLTSMSAGSVR